jgi:hypothetical protein
MCSVGEDVPRKSSLFFISLPSLRCTHGEPSSILGQMACYHNVFCESSKVLTYNWSSAIIQVTTGSATPLQSYRSLLTSQRTLHNIHNIESSPVTGLDRPTGFQEVEAPRFQDNRHMKVVRLSAIRTGRVYPPGNIPGTHFCLRLSRPQGHSATDRIIPMKNSTDTIGNRTRDLPVCSAVPQPTAPPRHLYIELDQLKLDTDIFNIQFNIIHPSTPGFLRHPFPSGFPTKIIFPFLVSPARAECPATIKPLDLITLIFCWPQSYRASVIFTLRAYELRYQSIGVAWR